MKLKKQPFIVVFLTLFFYQPNANAMEIQSLDEIRNTAIAYVYESMGDENKNIEVTIGQIDQRLRLKQCTKKLEAFNHGYASRKGLSTVGVRCNGANPWSLYVPVSIKVYQQVATLKRPVARNQILVADDISFKKTDIYRLNNGFFTNTEEIVGKILTQNLQPGAILTNYVLKTPIAIRQGQMVTLIARNSVIEVRTEGKAMSRGAIGDRIKVKNLKTKRIIEGVIKDNHNIYVNL